MTYIVSSEALNSTHSLTQSRLQRPCDFSSADLKTHRFIFSAVP